MTRFYYLFALLLGFAVLSPMICAPAHADYYKWQDPKSYLSVTLPDTWKRQVNRNTDDILTIAAPSGNERAQCVIKASTDKRYVIYPAPYGSAVQREAVSVPFWQAYMGNYDDYELSQVYDNAGLGRWHASYALARYHRHDGTAMQARRAIMFASLYNDTMYIVECSAIGGGFDRWYNDFRSIIKSIDFRKSYHERPSGEYANFLKDAELYFWSQTSKRGTTKY